MDVVDLLKSYRLKRGISLNKLAELFMPKSGKKTRSKDKFTLMQYTLEMNRSAKIKPKPKPEQN